MARCHRRSCPPRMVYMWPVTAGPGKFPPHNSFESWCWPDMHSLPRMASPCLHRSLPGSRILLSRQSRQLRLGKFCAACRTRNLPGKPDSQWKSQRLWMGYKCPPHILSSKWYRAGNSTQDRTSYRYHRMMPVPCTPAPHDSLPST